MYDKPWGQTMEILVEDWGKWLIDQFWEKGIDPATKKTRSLNSWLDNNDPGRLAYAILLEHAHGVAKESPPTVPANWEERVKELQDMRRDQYTSDLASDNFALKVDYFREILSISLDVGKTLAMLITAVPSPRRRRRSSGRH